MMTQVHPNTMRFFFVKHKIICERTIIWVFLEYVVLSIHKHIDIKLIKLKSSRFNILD